MKYTSLKKLVYFYFEKVKNNIEKTLKIIYDCAKEKGIKYGK